MSHKIAFFLYCMTLLVMMLSGSGHASETKRDMERLLNEGLQLFEQAKYQEALSLWLEGLAISRRLNERQMEANFLAGIGNVYFCAGDCKKALENHEKYEKAEEIILANVLSFTSERQRLLYQETTDPYSLICTLGCAPDIAQVILRHKGVVLDSLIEDIRVAGASKSPEQVALVEKLRSSKERLTKLLIETPKDMSEEGLKRVREERERSIQCFEAVLRCQERM